MRPESASDTHHIAPDLALKADGEAFLRKLMPLLMRLLLDRRWPCPEEERSPAKTSQLRQVWWRSWLLTYQSGERLGCALHVARNAPPCILRDFEGHV